MSNALVDIHSSQFVQSFVGTAEASIDALQTRLPVMSFLEDFLDLVTETAQESTVQVA